ncbi:hotdog domain-containing protein, partial [Luteitalea sp.]|uniref:acyl-CoA thioesterase n=1 Tax=Luteitalea sp. TaxID=2004800 RepID=UPI0025B9CEBB
CFRHSRSRVVTAAVDGLQFLHPIKVGDLILLKAEVTATFRTSMEVEVRVMSEETLTGQRKLTSHAYLTFVAIDADGRRVEVPDLVLETDAQRTRAIEAESRRQQRLAAKARMAQIEGELAAGR